MPADPDEPGGVYATLRPLLISIAHEMVGAVGEAGDIVQEAEVNGQPGVVFMDAEARAVAVIALDIAGGQIIAVRAISNPERLRHLDERPVRPRAGLTSCHAPARRSV